MNIEITNINPNENPQYLCPLEITQSNETLTISCTEQIKEVIRNLLNKTKTPFSRSIIKELLEITNKTYSTNTNTNQKLKLNSMTPHIIYKLDDTKKLTPIEKLPEDMQIVRLNGKNKNKYKNKTRFPKTNMNAKNLVFAVIKNSEIIALAADNNLPIMKNVYDIDVECAKEYRKMGYGKLIASHLCREMLKLGRVPAAVVRANNYPSRAMSTTLGMQIIGRYFCIIYEIIE